MIYRIALLDTIAVMRRDGQDDARIVCGDTGQTGKGKVEDLEADRGHVLIGEMHGGIQDTNILNPVIRTRQQTGRGVRECGGPARSNNAFTPYRILYKGAYEDRIMLIEVDVVKMQKLSLALKKNAPDGVRLGDLALLKVLKTTGERR